MDEMQVDSEPITEDWLNEVGFKWHELERQRQKHWLLWIGNTEAEHRLFASSQDLGIELTPGSVRPDNEEWHCWLRSDVSHKYSRFLYVRMLKTRQEVVTLIEALTGTAWNPDNNLYGAMRSARHAAYLRAEAERLDRRIMFARPWNDVEKDDSLGGALPQHLEAHEQAKKPE